MRQHRDTGWSLIRQKYIEGIPIPEDELRELHGMGGDLPDVYEAARARSR